MISEKPKSAHILLVEDNEGDIVLTKEAFQESQMITEISVAKNGQEALDFLYQKGIHATSKKPDLILLDLNMPIINGQEVLKKIKSDPELRKIPVIILSISSNKKDIETAYLNYANSYLKKSNEIDEFMETALKIEDFWLQLSVRNE